MGSKVAAVAFVVVIVLSGSSSALACSRAPADVMFTGRVLSIEDQVVRLQVLALSDHVDGPNHAPDVGQSIDVRFGYDAQFFDVGRDYFVVANTNKSGVISGLSTTEWCETGFTTFADGGLVDRIPRSRGLAPALVAGAATVSVVLIVGGWLFARRRSRRLNSPQHDTLTSSA